MPKAALSEQEMEHGEEKSFREVFDYADQAPLRATKQEQKRRTRKAGGEGRGVKSFGDLPDIRDEKTEVPEEVVVEKVPNVEIPSVLEIRDGISLIKAALSKMGVGDPRSPFLMREKRAFYDLIDLIEKGKVVNLSADKNYKKWKDFSSKEGYVYTNVVHELSTLEGTHVGRYARPNEVQTYIGQTFKDEPQSIHREKPVPAEEKVVAVEVPVPELPVVEAHAEEAVPDPEKEELVPTPTSLVEVVIPPAESEPAPVETPPLPSSDSNQEEKLISADMISERAAAIAQAEIPASAEVPVPLPRAEEMLRAAGITPEMAASIPELAEISRSEAKTAWFLEKFEHVKVRTIRNDAVEDVEKEIREKDANGWLPGKIMRKMGRKGSIEARAQEHARKGFDFEKYRNDLEGLAHLANASPDMAFQEKDGKREVVSQYLNIPGIDNRKLAAFNEAATAFSKVPPEYEWKRLSSKERKGYEALKQRVDEEAYKALLVINTQFVMTSSPDIKDGRIGRFGTTVRKYTDVDAMRMVNDAQFSLKMHQSLNNCPNAELELKRLIETTGWNRKWEVVKTQLGIAGTAGATGGGFGFAAGTAALRWGVKSSLVMAGATAALPVAAIGLGAWIGAKRGGMKAEEQFRREEELMRLGKEERKGKKATDLNFVDASSLTQKIGHLQEMIGMEYADYINKYKPVSLEEFQSVRKDLAEKLEVRLAYTKRKLDDGRILFGKKENALAERFKLLQQMGKASAEVALLPRSEKKREFVGNETGRVRTRKGRLNEVLFEAEELINENREKYIRHEKKKGALTGLLLGGVGFGAGHLLSGYVSEFVHDVQERIHELKATDFVEGKKVEDAFTAAMKVRAEHLDSAALIEESVPQIPSSELSNVSVASYSSGSNFPQSDEVFGAPKGVPELVRPQTVTKPFEYKLTNETQSREFALKKYYEGKGLSRLEAGKKAYLDIRKMFPKGERAAGWVHKGDNISIIEENGKVKMNVLHKGIIKHAVKAVAAPRLIFQPEALSSLPPLPKLSSLPELPIGGGNVDPAEVLAPRVNLDPTKFKRR